MFDNSDEEVIKTHESEDFVGEEEPGKCGQKSKFQKVIESLN